MKKLLVIMFCLQTSSTSQWSRQSFDHQVVVSDVFPLTRNLHYTYDYFSIWRVTEVSFLVQLNIDSGLVEYVVRDSVSSDSTILWNLEERQTLWHRRYDGYRNRDSVYWTYDTLFLPLSERTSGYHKLASSGLVWRFPLSTPAQDVYRYSDSTRLTLARQWATPSPPGSGVDTLQFSDSAGFFRRHTSYFGGGITYFSSALYVQLRGSPVVAANEPVTLPTRLHLSQNYPNPFNPSTTIEYSVTERAFVSLQLYDILGREVAVLEIRLKSNFVFGARAFV